ncbi:hypothetical protein GOBAR_DD23814 [Gossypium barbadense]|nr:hypothetical protein GOBAR_DD23814 [Gossypium barbadense]
MDAKFLVCVYFDGVILTTSVGCVFECQQQIVMRFNRNVSFDEMKARINAKIHRRCGRRISKIFYKFPVSTNSVKFVKMELVDDEDVETMVDLYCGNGSEKNAPIHLFAELVGIEKNEDVNASDEEDGAEEPWMVALISYVDSESTMGGISIDLNITPDVDMVGGEEEGGADHWDEEVNSDGDPDVDDVPDDNDDEDVNNDEGINASSVGEQMQRILIHNNPGPHMSLIDPDAAYVAEFPEYPEIVHSHGLAVTSDDDELFIGQRFSLEGCNWRVRATFIRSSQMWEIRKFVGPHTCTSTRMTEDHGKLDSKTICICIMPMVKDMPTIKVSVLITKMQARFQYRVSYRKAWIAKQMAIEQLYGDYDSSYNELQGWIAAIREYIPGTAGYFDAKNGSAASRPDLGGTCVCRTCKGCNGRKPSVGPTEFISGTDGTSAGSSKHFIIPENEFPVLPDLSTWKVPPITFELLLDRGLRRNPRGRPQSSRIRNEMDIREKSDGKHCGICRLSGYSRNKCPNRNFHVGQLSGSGRN